MKKNLAALQIVLFVSVPVAVTVTLLPYFALLRAQTRYFQKIWKVGG